MQQLISQLGIMENSLLSINLKVRDCPIQLMTLYYFVYTNQEEAVGKTDPLKMRIVVEKGAVLVRAPVRKIKLHL